METEVRFAVVLYGGVSLAIYMNGVTQEFAHLVRSSGVYKELAAITRSRFVVDIVSGTSAGGINAIFLGKALANGQSLDRLSQLWLEEADVKRLWNTSKLPLSILSGSQMYSVALEALDDMDDSGGSGPAQSEMDVFVTATDIQGLELPIQLEDMEVMERLHKNVFHLRFNESGTDFVRTMNPFLAFAARATSAFPVAFEPMRLQDAGGTLNEERFFPAYIASGADYKQRAFGDGGALNNKPFSSALSEIRRRVSDLPVRRLLMYVEPAPEQPAGNSSKPPGAIRNWLAELITLHQYETIREDLREALDRNELIRRVREISDRVESDVRTWQRRRKVAAPRLTGAKYVRRTLADEIYDRGPGYAGYHRLKVRSVTDALGEIVGSPKEVEVWRKRTYCEHGGGLPESAFLLHFDLGYRQRRLRFLIARLDEMDDSRELRRELTGIAASLANLERSAHKLDLPVYIDSAMIVVENLFRSVMIHAAKQIERFLSGHPLQHCFDCYEDYDQVTFPIFYETGVGEAEPVEIFRVSPLDAKSVMDETSPSERRRKLAGTALFHFAAFLKRDWRENDMLWGRLDGAERIISSVLPVESTERPRLIRDAHLSILREQFGDRAEAVYEDLKCSHEVNRGIGLWLSLRLLSRFAAVSWRMIATGLLPFGNKILSTLKSCVPLVTRR